MEAGRIGREKKRRKRKKVVEHARPGSIGVPAKKTLLLIAHKRQSTFIIKTL